MSMSGAFGMHTRRTDHLVRQGRTGVFSCELDVQTSDELDGDILAVIGLQASPSRFPSEEYAAFAARLVAAFEHICCLVKGLIAP
jgi:hypothetical protein